MTNNRAESDALAVDLIAQDEIAAQAASESTTASEHDGDPVIM